MSSTNLNFYSVGKTGTVQQTCNYDPEKAVEILYNSMKGLGTDEDAIIDVVATHTFQQRQELKMLYHHKYGKDLVKELDSELSFSFSKTVLALMTRPEHFIIDCIHQAISKSQAARLLKHLQKIYKKHLGSDEHSLIALLCPRSNAQLEAIKILYKKKYEKELEEDIGFDLGDDLRSLIIDMISGDRESEDPDIGVDLEKVLEDADNLHGASLVPVGEICGTKERVLQQILNMRSYEHLKQLIPAYEELSNKTMDEYIEHSELSPDLKEAYLIIVKILRSEPDYYAERLRDSIEGLGTDDDVLISIIVLRSEIDLRDIMHRYFAKFGVTLQDDVTGDTSGDYRHILLKILNLPDVDESRRVSVQNGNGTDNSPGNENEEISEIKIRAASIPNEEICPIVTEPSVPPPENAETAETLIESVQEESTGQLETEEPEEEVSEEKTEEASVEQEIENPAAAKAEEVPELAQVVEVEPEGVETVEEESAVESKEEVEVDAEVGPPETDETEVEKNDEDEVVEVNETAEKDTTKTEELSAENAAAASA